MTQNQIIISNMQFIEVHAGNNKNTFQMKFKIPNPIVF